MIPKLKSGRSPRYGKAGPVNLKPCVRQYVRGLLRERQRKFGCVVRDRGDILAASLDQHGQGPVVRAITITDIVISDAGGDDWKAALYVLLAQRLSVEWSKSLGLNVDDPFSVQGKLTRVVKNVQPLLLIVRYFQAA